MSAREQRHGWPRRAAIGVAAALCAAVPGRAPAQQLVAGGHALDGSLQLGSGGYNGIGASAPGRINTSVYLGGDRGLQYYNAFVAQQVYTPTAKATYGNPQAGNSGGLAAASSNRYAEAYSATYDASAPAAGAPGAPGAAPGPAPTLTPLAQQQMDAISYGLGFLLGEQLRGSFDRDSVHADEDAAIQGFRDGVFERQPVLPPSQMEKALADAEREVEARVVQGMAAEDPEYKKVLEDSLRRGREFQEEFGRRPGVVSLPDGIQHQVLRPGNGPSPKADDVVVVNYRTILLDGTILGQGRSQEVRVGSAIPGAATVLQMMNAGAKWLVVIPPELAYGPAGRFPDVGPNETLFGEVELLEIKPGPK